MSQRSNTEAVGAVVEVLDLLALADRYVKRWRRTRLLQQQRWNAIDEVELAHMNFSRAARDSDQVFWADVLVLTTLSYLIDDGSFRRDDFATARHMLTEELEEKACIPHAPS